MFPSNNPFDNYSHNLHAAASSFENPSPSSCFFNFPASLLDDEELLLDHFLRHNNQPCLQLPTPTDNTTTTTTTTSTPPTEDRGVTSHDHMNQNDEYQTNPVENTNLSSYDDIITNLNPSSNPHPPPPPTETAAAMKRKRGGGGVRTKQPRTGPPRRRAGKKDRHSKIHTAQGPRDRRMRLSLQIARKFFDLQDMLGFDKASKTIEWLFSKSKTAIKDLTATLPPQTSCASLSSANTNSNCIVSSSNLIKDKDEEEEEEDEPTGNGKVTVREDSEGDHGAENKIRTKKSSSSSVSNKSSMAARESREKARARARLRTMEKKKQKEMSSPSVEINNDDNNNNRFEKLGSSSTSEPTRSSTDPQEESGGGGGGGHVTHSHTYYHHHDMFENCTSQLQQSSLENQMASVGIIEKLLGGGGGSSSASSSSIYDDYSGYMGFPPNWVGMDSNTRSLISSSTTVDYGAISCLHDPTSMLLQQQNPNHSMFSASGLYLQSQYFENQFSGSSSDPGLL